MYLVDLFSLIYTTLLSPSFNLFLPLLLCMNPAIGSKIRIQFQLDSIQLPISWVSKKASCHVCKWDESLKCVMIWFLQEWLRHVSEVLRCVSYLCISFSSRPSCVMCTYPHITSHPLNAKCIFYLLAQRTQHSIGPFISNTTWDKPVCLSSSS